MHTVSHHMQNTIAQHHQRRAKVTGNHQFHYARKTNRNRDQSDDARNRRAREPSPQRKLRLPEKTQCFVHILIQIASMIHENEAFVQGFLRIPRVEDMKTRLSCEASFQFQELKHWTHLFNAAVPMQKVSTGIEIKAMTPETVSHASHLCNGSSVYPKKHNVSCKS